MKLHSRAPIQKIHPFLKVDQKKVMKRRRRRRRKRKRKRKRRRRRREYQR